MSARYKHEFIGEEFYVAVVPLALVAAAAIVLGWLCRIPRFSRPSYLHHSTARSSCTRATCRQSPAREGPKMTCQRPIDKGGSVCLVRHGTPQREIPRPSPKH
ncbi:hypothetical protein E2C01_042269 [Portunus trituberculatus]|uniref:Uncharacterized protein n=1 Tax=Portunus trituberculatus TaxID=210409 RepID=A0A5B7FSM0_PORTR|nr:hypothetical protein [Portunus trituberculatus]